jgi:hypothetical protein
MPPASHQVSATSLKLLIQQIHSLVLHAGFEVEEHCAGGGVIYARGLVVKHVISAELRVAAAAVIAVAAFGQIDNRKKNVGEIEI